MHVCTVWGGEAVEDIIARVPAYPCILQGYAPYICTGVGIPYSRVNCVPDHILPSRPSNGWLLFFLADYSIDLGFRPGV